MKSRQRNKFNMYLAVEAVLTTFESVMSGFLKFSGFFYTLKNGIVQIRELDQQQVVDKKGIAVNKGQLRGNLVKLIDDLCRKLRAYATMENNEILLGEIKITESKLKRCDDNELHDIAKAIYNRGEAHLTDLETYQYSGRVQTATLKAITDFGASIPSTRVGAIDSKQITEQMAGVFEVVDVALTNIDVLAEVLKLSNPEFYGSYRSARKIINLGSGSIVVKGFVKDSATGEGLKNVIISFALVENTNGNGMMKANGIAKAPTLEKKTAAKGGFNVKSMADGTYSVTMKKIGYADEVTTLNVVNGELAVLEVAMTSR